MFSFLNAHKCSLNARKSLANGRGPSVELSGLSPSFRIAEPTTVARSFTMNGHKVGALLCRNSAEKPTVTQSMNEEFHETESKDIEINVHKSRITDVA